MKKEDTELLKHLLLVLDELNTDDQLTDYENGL